MDDRVTSLPPHQEALKVGDTWELTDETFDKWWGMLAEDDRQEFSWLHHGDIILARFVCALDYLIIQKVQAEESHLIQLAYFIAAVRYEPTLTLETPDLRARSVRAWKHDAVQALIDRVRYRDSRNASNRIQGKLVTLLENMIEEAIQGGEGIGLKDKRFAADAAIRFLQVVDFTESRMRSERTKRGIEQARKAFANPDEDLGPRELEAFAKVAFKKLGKDKVKALLGDSADD
jgi:hypothetical protein